MSQLYAKWVNNNKQQHCTKQGRDNTLTFWLITNLGKQESDNSQKYKLTMHQSAVKIY